MHPTIFKKKKTPGILDVIKSYEVGLMNKRDFKVQVTKVKLRQLRQQEKFSIARGTGEPYDAYSCDGVIAYDKSFVAAWRVGFSTFVHTVTFNPSRSSDLNIRLRSLYKENYVCQLRNRNLVHMHPVRMNGYHWALLCLNRDEPYSFGPNVHTFQLVPIVDMSLFSVADNFKFEIVKTLHCFTYSDRMKLIVVGTSDGIITSNIAHNSYVNSHVQCPKYNYTAVEFDWYENLLYCVSSNGKMFTMDTRIADFIDEKEVGRGVSCLKILSDNYTLLLSGYDNDLRNIDMRMKRTVCMYPGHINQCKKIQFNFNEERSILCSAGQDNVTRFWDLYRGEPLAFLEPPLESTNQLISQLHVKNQKLYSLLFIDGEIFSYESIC